MNFQNLKKRSILTQIFILVLVVNIVSCGSNNKSIEYESEKKLPMLTLKNGEEIKLEGDEKDFKLELYNPNAEPIASNTIKLQIQRTLGKDAIIVGSIPTDFPNIYEMTINEEIMGAQTLRKNLTIDSKTDAEAEFTIQLIQEGIRGDAITVKWKQGVQLELYVKFEGNTRKLVYSITNKGIKETSSAVLQYTCKTSGIKLAGLVLNKGQTKQVPIGNIAINGKLENQVLGEIDFGSNTDAEFAFKVVYEGGSTEEKNFVYSALDVQLSIEKIVYNAATNEVTYSIHNKGKDRADEVQVRYTNESQDEAGKKVLIASRLTGKTAAISVNRTSGTGLLKLPIDFKQADEATFKFELLYKGVVVTQATEIKIFKTKEVKLKLIPIGNVALVGTMYAFKFRIVVEAGGRSIASIDPKYVQLSITNSNGNTSFVTRTIGATRGVNELTGIDLGSIGDEITLYINPKTEKEARFELKLNYKNNLQRNPLTVSWQEENIRIKNLKPFLGNNEASFSLYSTTGTIDHSQLTIALSSNNKASFTLLEEHKHGGGNSLVLNQLIGTGKTDVNTTTKNIYLKLLNANGEHSAKVTVHVKRGAKLITTQTVNWEQPKINLNLSPELGAATFSDQDLYTIKLENVGDVVDTSKIRIRLINDQNITFQVGNFLANATIDVDLKTIIGKAQLAKKEKIQFNLQQDASVATEVYDSDIIIELLDEGRITLGKLRVKWINRAKRNLELKLLYKKLETFEKEFEKNKQAAIGTKGYKDKIKFIEGIADIRTKLELLNLEASKLLLMDDDKVTKEVIHKELITPANGNIQGIDTEIIKFLQNGRDELQEIINRLNNSIDGLYSSIRSKENKTPLKERKGMVAALLSDKIDSMHTMFYSVTAMANLYDTGPAKDIAKEADGMVAKTKERIKQLGDEIDESAKKLFS